MLPKYKRILLKLSGESLMGDNSFGLDPEVIAHYARDIKTIVELGVQVAIVIGGGNIYRGMNEAETGIERAHGDYMGMPATVINGMALQASLAAGSGEVSGGVRQELAGGDDPEAGLGCVSDSPTRTADDGNCVHSDHGQACRLALG